ncbi:MFS transporter [Roseateles cavernae]|uniref:MFS transporter n=1 Tax=Roseateles cavernae TaxID=3153578 RepID=UPI0032E38EE9
MIAVMRGRVDALGPPFRALLCSELLSWLALMVGAVAAPWWIAGQGGARDLAIYGFSAATLAVIVMPVLSPLGDRLAKRRLIMLGLVLYALVALLLASLVSLDHYHLGWVLLAALLSALASGLLMPTLMTVAADLVETPQLPDALSLQRSAQSLGRVLGPALGGSLLAWSTGAALWLQAGLLFSAVLLARRLPQRAPPARAGRGMSAWRDDLRQGLRASWTMPLERGWTLVNFVGMLFMFPAFTMLVPLKIKALGLSGAWLGAAETGLSLGMLVGALGGSAWVARRIGRYATRVGATAAQGLGLALAGWTGQGEVLVLALFLVGLANSCGVLVGQTHRMLAIPEHFRARLSSVGMMTMNIAAAAGPALAGLALLKLEVATVYFLFGLLSAASALGYLFVPDFKTLLTLDHEQVKDWYAHRHPELFGAAPKG